MHTYAGITLLTILGLSLVILLFIVLLPLIAIIDILRSKFEGNDAILMLLLVLFVPFGVIVYFFIAPARKIRN